MNLSPFATRRRVRQSAICILHAAIVLLALAAAGALAAPTWRSLGPGGGGWIPCLAVSPHDSRVVYAGCDVGGFYKSTDAGDTWRICNTGLHDLYVEAIAPHPRDPKVIYLGTEGGVHKSGDGGETWQWLREGFPPATRWAFSAPIGALALDPQNPDNVYAGIGRPRWRKSGAGTLYKSADAGAHWQIANPGGGGMDPQAILSDLAVHPRESRRLYAATDKGLYRSDDAGATWRRLEQGLPHAHVRRVALCIGRPETLYVSMWSPPGREPWQGGVYRSDDGGESWMPRLQGLATRVGKPGEASQMTSNVDRLAVHPESPDVVYAGDTAWVSAGVYRTTDGGQSWQRATDSRSPAMQYGWITMWGPSVMGLAMDPRRPDTLYFSTSGHLFRTTDRGAHWDAAYTRKAEKPAGAPDSVAAWWSGTGLEVTCLNRIAVHPRDPRRLYFCYMDIGLLQTFDGGRTFAHTVQGMRHRGNNFAVAFDPDNPEVIFAGTGEWGANVGDVCRSEDGGLTWKVVGNPQSGLPNGQTRHLIVDRDSPSAARRVYVTVNGAGVFCSEDGGATWQARNNGLPDFAVRGMAQHPRDPKTLFLLLAQGQDHRGGIWRTDDRGQSWRYISGDLACPDAKALAISPADPQRVFVAARETKAKDQKVYPGGVFATADGGATWKRVLEDHFIESLAVDPTNPDVLYAGGNDHPYHDEALGLGVMRSRDGGRTWESLNGDLPNRKVTCIVVSAGRILVGTGGNGVWGGSP